MNFKCLVLYLLLVSLFACALPPARQSALPRKDEALQHLERGLYFFGKNRYGDAEKSFRLALRLMPNSPKVKHNLAVTLFNNEQPLEAKEILLDLLQRDPDNYLYVTTLASLYVSEYSYNKAFVLYERAYEKALLEKDKRRSALFARNLSEIAFVQGREEIAFCYSEDALRHMPLAEEASHVALLSALNQVKRIEQESESLERARQRRDKDVLFWHALNSFELEQYDQAYFLANIVETEIVSSGGVLGFSDFSKVVTRARNEKIYSGAHDLVFNSPVKLTKLQRNYWPLRVLKRLSTGVM